MVETLSVCLCVLSFDRSGGVRRVCRGGSAVRAGDIDRQRRRRARAPTSSGAAARRSAANAIEQCHVYSGRRKLDADLSGPHWLTMIIYRP